MYFSKHLIFNNTISFVVFIQKIIICINIECNKLFKIKVTRSRNKQQDFFQNDMKTSVIQNNIKSIFFSKKSITF